MTTFPIEKIRADFPILVVLRADFNYFEMIKKTSFLTAELSLQNDTVISCVFVSKEDFDKRSYIVSILL